VSSERITYTPRPDATSPRELDTLANVYRYVLDRTNAAGGSGGEEARKEDQNASGNVSISR
jgi:hypothetical protein